MKKYIITLDILVNGKMKKLYHEKLTLSERKDVMNVYVDHSTKDKDKALVFYDADEAQRMAHFLCTEFCNAKVIPL